MRTPLFLLALLLPLTACGDDEPSAAPSASARATASSTPHATTTRSPTAAAPTATSTTPSAAPATTTAPTTTAPTTDAPSPTTAPGSASPATPARPPRSGAPRLTGDGIDLPSRVLVFSTTYVDARAPLDDALGPPSLDTGAIDTFSSYGTCPGKDLRVLEYAGGALRLLFGTLQGSTGMTFYSWVLADDGTPSGVPEASAFVGDVTTFELRVGTTLGQLQAGLGQTLTVNPGDELGGPTFRVADQSSGLFGRLTSTASSGAVTHVQAGPGCGE